MASCRAVLCAHNGEELGAVTLQYPPPFEFLVPRRRRLSVTMSDEPQQFMPSDHRVFRLQPNMRARHERWWRVLKPASESGGGSVTPEDGFVYIEAQEKGSSRGK